MADRYRVLIIQSNNPEVMHYVDNVLDLKIGGESICGVDFFRQEAREAQFSCKLDDWLREQIINVHDGHIQCGYVRMRCNILGGPNGNTLLFTGFIRPGSWAVDPYYDDYQRISFNLTDLMGVIIDIASGMNVSLAAGTYVPQTEMITRLNEVLAAGTALFNGVYQPSIWDDYDETAWTPYTMVQLPIVTDPGDALNYYDYPISQTEAPFNSANPTYSGAPIMRMDLSDGVIYLTFVYYRVARTRLYDEYYDWTLYYDEYLDWRRWRVEGANITPDMTFINTRQRNSSIFDNEMHQNWDHQGETEWIQSLNRLSDQYAFPTQANAGLSSGSWQYDIEDNDCLFTGRTAFESISVTTATEMSMLDWLRVVGQITAMWLQPDDTTQFIRIRNKLSIYETAYETAPATVLRFKIVSNDLAGSMFDQDLSFLHLGNEIIQAINNYFSGLTRHELKYMAEMRLTGNQGVVGTRYFYKGFMMFCIEKVYEIETNSSVLKLLGRSMAA